MLRSCIHRAECTWSAQFQTCTHSKGVYRNNFAVQPLPPSGLVAWRETSDQIALYWTDPNDQYVTGYEYQLQLSILGDQLWSVA